ncbi:MAG: flagellar hook protein FlgE [Actinomycetota bacterium]|nr:flagellar hook protein FlgE [Actinomycetota bacterium]
MMRSMFSAVSGLRNHQVKMDVIGNNVANVNTVGFKASRVTFQDMLNQTMRGATAPQESLGGSNPQQVGLGMLVKTIDIMNGQGSLESTGKLTDLAIQGDGFFVLNDGISNKYTRAGVFDINLQKNMVDPSNGYKVMGWQADDAGTIDSTLPPTEILIPIGELMVAQATDTTVLSGNLDADPGAVDGNGNHASVSVQIYDSLGIAHNLVFGFAESATPDAWTWKWQVDGGSWNTDTDQTITFSADGTFSAEGGGTISIAAAGGANPITIDPDFTNLTQFDGSDSNIIVRSQNGFPMGTLETFSIGSDGLITGVFSNGMNKTLACLALGVFGNPGGLTRMGGTMFQQSTNSGEVRLVAPGTSGLGSVVPGSLEMSNVDLAQEFTNMIVTQRGFQANSRIISASDEMLTELVNLKR